MRLRERSYLARGSQESTFTQLIWVKFTLTLVNRVREGEFELAEVVRQAALRGARVRGLPRRHNRHRRHGHRHR